MQFDIVIVGAGTAGCAVAAQLARHTDLSIGVVEAGGRYPAWALHAPLAGLRLRSFWSWRHESMPIPGLAGRTVVYPMGRVVGGTSAVNAMIATAGHPQDYPKLRTWESLFGFLGGPPFVSADVPTRGSANRRVVKTLPLRFGFRVRDL